MSDALHRELAEAEAAMAASERAIRTHGHQAITWVLYRADAERLEKARAALLRRKKT